jgi:hypothetical protein
LDSIDRDEQRRILERIESERAQRTLSAPARLPKLE